MLSHVGWGISNKADQIVYRAQACRIGFVQRSRPWNHHLDLGTFVELERFQRLEYAVFVDRFDRG